MSRPASAGPAARRCWDRVFCPNSPPGRSTTSAPLLVLKTKGDDAAASTAAESGQRRRLPSGSGPPYGAFAHDGTSGRYGASWNQASQARADEAALKGCASEYCKIVFRMTARQCGALAMTDNGKIWGGATRTERNAAERAAVENCEKRTSTSCRLRSVQCNR